MFTPKTETQKVETYISFNMYLADKYGIKEAIIIQDISYWVLKNQDDDRNTHDDYNWTFNNTQYFAEKISSTIKTTQRILKKLETDGILKIGNYNKIQYDRTKWYTIIDEEIASIYGIDLSTDDTSPSVVDELEEDTTPTLSLSIQPLHNNDNSKVTIYQFEDYYDKYEDYYEPILYGTLVPFGLEEIEVDISHIYNQIMAHKSTRYNVINKEDMLLGFTHYAEKMFI